MAQHSTLRAMGLIVAMMTICGVAGVDCALAEKLPWTDYPGSSSSGPHLGANHDDQFGYWGGKYTDQIFWGERHATGIFGKLYKLGEYPGYSTLVKHKAAALHDTFDNWADAFTERKQKGRERWHGNGDGLLGTLKHLFHRHKDKDYHVVIPEPASFIFATLGLLCFAFYVWRCRKWN